MLEARTLRFAMCFAGLLAFAAAHAPIASATGRVIGGTKIDPPTFHAEWGWTVSVGRVASSPLKSHSCGGVLIDRRIVLTARHCVEQGGWSLTPKDLRVHVGTTNLAFGGQTIRVTEIYRTPDLPDAFFQANGDLAILHLSQAATAQPVQLARPEHSAWWGAGAGRTSGVRVAGWGVSRDADIRKEVEFGPVSRRLQVADVPVLSGDACAAAARGDRSTRRHICAGSKELKGTPATEGRSSCYGDSGGPLLAADPAGIEPPRVIGIVSRGTSDECASGPTIYVNVASQSAWIDRVVSHLTTPTLRGSGPGFAAVWRVRGALRVKTHGVVPDGATFAFDYRPYGTASWRELARFRSSEYLGKVPPTHDGWADVRIRMIGSDGLELAASRVLEAAAKIDTVPPGRIERFRATRRGPSHFLTWTPARDSNDFVSGYLIEQRRVGARRWSFEGYLDCMACLTNGRARPGVRSQHVLLPGRREFRIAALDRAGNLGPWTLTGTPRSR